MLLPLIDGYMPENASRQEPGKSFCGTSQLYRWKHSMGVSKCLVQLRNSCGISWNESFGDFCQDVARLMALLQLSQFQASRYNCVYAGHSGRSDEGIETRFADIE
jgi:hypothetical protein